MSVYQVAMVVLGALGFLLSLLTFVVLLIINIKK
ncbi:putative holin-like toxin (plasmid) [Leuconostoc suionicum]